MLVPLDGSDLSESMIPLGVSLARRWNAEVLLVRACDPALASAPELPATVKSRLQQRSLAAAEEYLGHIRPQFGELAVSQQCPLDRARDIIPTLALTEQCDLILMASHGRKGPERWIMGSVAEAVLRRSHTPVLIAHPPAPAVAEFHNVLIPVDGSPVSLEAVQKVTPYLSRDARVTLMQCSGINPQELDIEGDSLVTQHYLDQMAVRLRELKTPGFQAEISVTHGQPVEQILEWASQNQPDLIVMSTRGRTDQPYTWLGSVTERVLRSAPCPVLACPKS